MDRKTLFANVSHNFLRMQDSSGPKSGGAEPEGHIITEYKPKLAKPSFYKVMLLNDDFTPMDFVINVLKKFFNKVDADATRIMLEVHHKGSGLAGIFTHEVAETKVYLVNEFSKAHQHPLKCIMEKDS